MFGIFGKKEPEKAPKMGKNPHLGLKSENRSGFFSNDAPRFFEGWESHSSEIDWYLRQELESLMSRSRQAIRKTPYAKRYDSLMRSNIVGSRGVSVQARTMFNAGGSPRLDERANTAIELAFKDWGQGDCDYVGKCNLVDTEKKAISSSVQDGCFLYRKHFGSGKYGFQLEELDPYTLNIIKNEKLNNGGEIRLGIEFNAKGKVVRYWFKESSYNGLNQETREYSVPAKYILHGFVPEFVGQSRGIPWMHAGLEKAKHLEKYQEAAIVKARSTAATMAFIKSSPGEEYRGEEGGYEDGTTVDQFDAGTIKDIGDRDIVNADFSYPHQMYEAFVKRHLHDIAAAWGVSYQSLTTDLEGTSFSSGRTGVLEEREHYKDLQEWFIHSFVKPVYEDWLTMAYMKGEIKIGKIPLSRPVDQYLTAHYQGRRWSWVDPSKDLQASQLSIQENLKSRSQIMREQGDDPDSTWREIAREKELMKELGIQPIMTGNNEAKDDEEKED